MPIFRGILALGACLIYLCLLAPVSADVDGTVSPIIGVLAQEVYIGGLISRHYNASSYISASYVKYVEGAGGRVVPIWIGRDQDYYEQLLLKINGVLLPGGAVLLNTTKGYSKAGEHIIRIAKEINDNGTYFPVWGTCLGMELLVLKMANDFETRTRCNSLKQLLPLEFKQDYKESRMFSDASNKITSLLATENITYNNHRFCYTEKSFDEPVIKGSWRIISLNRDWNGFEFVSTIEHVKYPFYGVQWHPEKPLHDLGNAHISVSTVSFVLNSQYFAQFFIGEARRNNHKFLNQTEQMRSLIYNYNPKYIVLVGAKNTQLYLFNINEVTGNNENPYPIEQIRNGAESQFNRVIIVLAVAFSAFLKY